MHKTVRLRPYLLIWTMKTCHRQNWLIFFKAFHDKVVWPVKGFLIYALITRHSMSRSPNCKADTFLWENTFYWRNRPCEDIVLWIIQRSNDAKFLPIPLYCCGHRNFKDKYRKTWAYKTKTVNLASESIELTLGRTDYDYTVTGRDRLKGEEAELV